MDLIEGIKTAPLVGAFWDSYRSVWEMDLIEGIKTTLDGGPLPPAALKRYEKWTW